MKYAIFNRITNDIRSKFARRKCLESREPEAGRLIPMQIPASNVELDLNNSIRQLYIQFVIILGLNNVTLYGFGLGFGLGLILLLLLETIHVCFENISVRL